MVSSGLNNEWRKRQPSLAQKELSRRFWFFHFISLRIREITNRGALKH
jgi:hypothetical protein